jgi:hypothetical protein
MLSFLVFEKIMTMQSIGHFGVTSSVLNGKYDQPGNINSLQRAVNLPVAVAFDAILSVGLAADSILDGAQALAWEIPLAAKRRLINADEGRYGVYSAWGASMFQPCN